MSKTKLHLQAENDEATRDPIFLVQYRSFVPTNLDAMHDAFYITEDGEVYDKEYCDKHGIDPRTDDTEDEIFEDCPVYSDADLVGEWGDWVWRTEYVTISREEGDRIVRGRKDWRVYSVPASGSLVNALGWHYEQQTKKEIGTGVDWVETVLGCEMSPLGAAVANLLGELFHGIYHLQPDSNLTDVEWDDDFCIDVRISSSNNLATYDGNLLTRLVYLSHQRMVRVEVVPRSQRYLTFRFHKRHSRYGRLHERMPTIDHHIGMLKRHYDGHLSGVDPKAQAAQLIMDYAGDAPHHRQWALDQALRLLLGDQYEQKVASIEWYEGVGP